VTADILHDYIAGRLGQDERQCVERTVRTNRDAAKDLSDLRSITKLVQATFVQPSTVPPEWLDLLERRPIPSAKLAGHDTERTKTWL
jgi:anti-sigma-K factor RskA